MSKISVLPDLLINKIAAGEVIERPASVVRELIDNSIDAGATRIDVEVMHGGKKLIRVSDNGQGMDREDAGLCFERHATSKIRSEDELFDIATLGFRGEALPAIASVSKVTMTTYDGYSDAGVKLELGVSREPEITYALPTKGTTVEIRDIFYNTPARRKFLKTTPTELSHIINTVIRKAFAYPATAFHLQHNKSELLNAPAAKDLKERLVQLYGDEMAAEFVSVSKAAKAIKVEGFAAGPEFTRSSRSHQIIFVNRRPVNNATVNHAVYDVYREMMPAGRHPAFFIFLEIDPRMVDVNVHPAKREVKFERPDDIHRIVRAAVFEALNPGHEVDVSAPSAHQNPVHGGAAYTFKPENMVREHAPFFNKSQTGFFTNITDADISSYFHIGESFVATVRDGGLMIIDRHAAHERILYEKFLKSGSVDTEQLFLPLRLELPVREYNIIIKHGAFFRRLGLEIEDFGKNNVLVRAVPKELRKTDIRGLLMDTASGIVEEETTGIIGGVDRDVLLKRIAAGLACHKSVRGSEHLNNEEMSQMISDLEKTEEPDKCPHGRPTRIMLTIHELQKMFKRK